MESTGRNSVIADDAILGRNVTIGNNVTIHSGVRVGDDCVILDGAVLGRMPRTTGTTTRPLNPTGSLEIGAGSIVGANAVVYTGSCIGCRTMISDLASLREGCRIGNDVIVGRAVLVMYDTVIGDRTRIIDGAIITGNMTIEEDVFIGPGVMSINDNQVYLRRFGLQPLEVCGPTVRRFALIGAGANLAAGVEIGEGAIVAPNAMVTRDVEPWTVVAGVPARKVRAVPDDDREKILRRFEAVPLQKAS